MSLRSRFVHFGTALLLLGVGGCYSYRPLTSAPAPGMTASFTVTDPGRVRLGPVIGERARRLEGVVDSLSDSVYVLRMRSVSYDDGQTQAWTGERIIVGRQDVTNARAREFSRARTMAFTAASVGGAVALVLTRGLLVAAGSDSDGGGKDNPPPVVD